MEKKTRTIPLKSEDVDTQNKQISPWWQLETLLGPLILLPVLMLYLSFDGPSHFFLHALMGWDVVLIGLLLGTYRGHPWSHWDGFLLLGVSLYALMPDIFSKFGWFHRDWMDIFLLHVTIDEILPFALPVLAILWSILLCTYILFRMRGIHGEETQRRNTSRQESIDTTAAFLWRKRLGLLLIVSVTILTILSTSGLSMEHIATPPLIRVGQRAPDFALLSTKGRIESLKGATQHIVLLGFMPSVLCTFCFKQLQILQEASSELSTHGGVVYVISTDTPLLQQTIAQRLGLDYSMLSEAPTMNQHPAGSAYGIYHQDAAPVDTNTFIVIDTKGIVRALRITPDQPITGNEIRSLLKSVLGPIGANHRREYMPPLL